MNKFAFALLKEIDSYFGEEKEYSIETKIEDLFCDSFDDLSWIDCLINLELVYGFDIPDELADQTNLSILEFGVRLSTLPFLPEKEYPEFFVLKTSMLQES